MSIEVTCRPQRILIFWLLMFMHHTPLAKTAAMSYAVAGKVILIDSRGNTLPDASNVVLFIDGPSEPPPQTKARISQKNQNFSPSVLPIVKGQTVSFPNDDIIYHNVFSLSKTKRFDLGVYEKGLTKYITFDQTGLVTIYCNIHPNMLSTILVLNNSLFSTTNTDGNFEIKGIPTDQTTLRTWHQLSDSQNITLTPESATSPPLFLTITIPITKSIRSHNNKFGNPYKTKY